LKGWSAALVCFLLIAAGGWWWADHSRDTGRIERNLRAAQRRFEEIPEEAFLRDRANLLEGRVVDRRGAPLAGAELRVLRADAVEDALGRVGPGDWLEPASEVEGTSEADGTFRFAGLSYGGKLLIGRSPKSQGGLLPEIPFADGYGAREIDAVLAVPPALAWTLLEPDGSPAAGLEVSLLPRSLAGRRVATRTDSGGRLRVPLAARTGDGEPRILAGNPPVLLAPPEKDGILTLPPAHDLVLIVRGAPDGASASLTLFPDGAPLPGAWKISARIRSGKIVIPRVREGRYELLLAVGTRARWAPLLHDRSPHEILLQEPHRLEVRLVDASGHPLASRVAWQPVPFQPPAAFETDPLLQLGRRHPLRRVVETGADGRALFRDLPLAGGWILVEGGGAPPLARRILPEETEVRLERDPGLEIALRTARPYLPIEVEGAATPVQTGRTDAAGEIFVRVPPGPLVARAGIARGGRSYPRGLWAGTEDGPLIFTALGDRGRPDGCIFGFVTRNGSPLPDVPVYLQGRGAPRREKSDASGFFRFPGLGPGTWTLVVRPAEPAPPPPRIQEVVLEPSQDLRRDLDLPGPKGT